MQYISNLDIKKLKIKPTKAIELVIEAFLSKPSSFLPHKTSITYEQNKFFNVMPTVIPSINAMAVKIVDRYPKRVPTIDGQILFYNYENGDLTHILDAAWITNARTGAVCATAINTLAIKNFQTISIMGLGNTAKASMSCILESNKEKLLNIKLLKYFDKAEKFIDNFKDYKNVNFEVVDNMKDFICDSDVIVSCITNTDSLLSEPEWFKKGCLLVPVHTKGFQNCDLVFDKIIVDDIDHVSNFKYFNQYKNFYELSDVLSNRKSGRENDDERIISYNIGIAIHDIAFSKYIIDELKSKNYQLEELNLIKENNDFSF